MAAGKARDGQRTASEFAVEEIRRAILSGELAANSPIRQETLAKGLSLSRMPVREALRVLEAEGLVRFRPQYGFSVAGFGAAEVMEAALIRYQLESLALRRALEVHEDQTLAIAESTLRQLVDSDADKLDLHARLHMALYKPCAMPRLLELIQHNLNVSNRFLVYADHLVEGVRAEDDLEHTQLFNAVHDRAARLADALLHMHIVDGAEDLVQRMEMR